MRTRRRPFAPLDQRGPLRVLFVSTSLPIGGAETLLVDLVRGLDPEQFRPEICCLKDRGPLGDLLRREFPVHSNLLASKHDVRVWPRLCRLLRQRQIDALVTVGAGDKMFWGRLAARRVGLPVVLSALHSTGWPDVVGRLNRMLTPLTDGFIAVADRHGDYLVDQLGFPPSKVHVIPNGVDVDRFHPNPLSRQAIRRDLQLHEDTPVVGIVAALRPEKNHLLFLRAAQHLRQTVPDARFVIVGDGPQREQLEVAIDAAGLQERVIMLGARNDIPDLLAALDVFVLSSHMEANPVSILEAMATGLPVVATDVGSIAETVHHGQTGYLAAPGDAQALARHCHQLVAHPERAQQFGAQARSLVAEHWSLQQMIHGYELLIRRVYQAKCGPASVQRPSSSSALPPQDVPQQAAPTP